MSIFFFFFFIFLISIPSAYPTYDQQQTPETTSHASTHARAHTHTQNPVNDRGMPRRFYKIVHQGHSPTVVELNSIQLAQRHDVAPFGRSYG